MKNKIRILLLLTLLFFVNIGISLAQTDAKADFNSAVDQINCETVKFIHREADRGDVADKMQCFTFESTYKTIPEDEANTTGQLSKKINAYKDKFKPDADLSKQLDQVIEYASGRINAKKRKGSVNDFKEKLNDIKLEALENIKNAAPGPETATSTTDDTSSKITVAEDEEILPETHKAAESGPVNWLGWLSLIISLISLFLAGYVFFRVRNIMAEADAKLSRLESEGSGGGRPAAPLVSESPSNYRLLESKIQDELRKIRHEMDEKIAAVGASAGNAPDSSNAALEEFEILPEDLKETDEDRDTFAASNQEQEEEINQAEPVHAHEPETVVQPPIDTNVNTGRTIISSSVMDAEEGEMLPVYKYAGIPSHEGYFSADEITEDPNENSVFEIEMYEDVPERAFFSVLNYKEVVQKSLAEPEKYLKPFCRYDQDPAGKEKIILMEEGLLQRNADRWEIAEKMRVRLE